MTIGRAWDLARLVIAVVVFLVAGTMVVLRIHDEARRSRASPTPTPRVSLVSKDFVRQCEEGSASACLDLGLEWLADGTLDGDTEARQAFATSCDGGDAQGCHNLGRMLAEGAGGGRDRAGARTAYVKACRQGLPWSCHAGALLVVDDDGPRAAEMLERACEQSYAAACYELALLTEQGRGVPQDARKARSLLESACKAGEGRACEVLRATDDAAGGPPPTASRR